MRNRNARARVEEGLFDGEAWWLPWAGLGAVFLAVCAWLFIPVLRSAWIFLPMAMLLAASVAAWMGFSRGNAAQRAASVLAVLLVLGLSGQLAKSFFAFELEQGVSTAESTTGFSDQ